MRALIFIALIVALWVFLGSTLQWVAALAGTLIAVLLFLFLRKNLMANVFISGGRGWRHPLDATTGVARYAWAVMRSNFRVAFLILAFRRPLESAVLKLHIGEMGDLEQTILANSITLTPGTISVDFSEDCQFIYVHVLDVADIESARRELLDHLEIHFGKGLRWWISPST